MIPSYSDRFAAAIGIQPDTLESLRADLAAAHRTIHNLRDQLDRLNTGRAALADQLDAPTGPHQVAARQIENRAMDTIVNPDNVIRAAHLDGAA